jgi:23S rRNA (adenine2503-C2)-methyltransferase
VTSISKGARAAGADFTVDLEVVSSRSQRRHRKCCCVCRRRCLPEGDEVECVYIPETDRGTLCVSQVGCTLTCSFCHTGTQRLAAQPLQADRRRIMVARDRLNDWADRGLTSRLVTNVVMMGMGDRCTSPVRDALLIVADNEGIGIRAAASRCDLGRGAEYRPAPATDRRHAGDLVACCARRVAQRAGALNRKYRLPNYSGLPRLSGLVERAAHHLQYVMLKGVNDPGRRQTAGENAKGIPPRSI